MATDMTALNVALGKAMVDINATWEKKAKYVEWVREQVKQNKFRLLVYRIGKMFSYYPEYYDIWNCWYDKKRKKYHISVSSRGISEVKIMSAKLKRRVTEIDEEIKRLTKKRNNIITRSYDKLNEKTPIQMKHMVEKTREMLKGFGVD